MNPEDYKSRQLTQEEAAKKCPQAMVCQVAAHDICTLAELHNNCGVYHQLILAAYTRSAEAHEQEELEMHAHISANLEK